MELVNILCHVSVKMMFCCVVPDAPHCIVYHNDGEPNGLLQGNINFLDLCLQLTVQFFSLWVISLKLNLFAQVVMLLTCIWEGSSWIFNCNFTDSPCSFSAVSQSGP